MSDTTIPETMKRLVVTEPAEELKNCKIEVETVPVPKLQPNDVLVKVAAAAINPSDYSSWTRLKPDQCPCVMGNEGCGTVVATGGSFVTKRFKIGAKVGLVGLKNRQGTYSEYVSFSAAEGAGAFPLPDDVPVEEAASFFVNPYTALAILDTARHVGSRALVHTAAASQLGQMMVKLAQQDGGMEIINVVRRAEQAKILTDLGAKHVVVTDEPTWKETLKSKIDELKATVIFDAVAGDGAGELLEMLPDKGKLFIYGGLSGKAGGFDPVQLIYKMKEVKGFYLGSWVSNGGMLMMIPRMMMAGKKVNAGLTNGGWSSTQFKDTTLEKAKDDTVALLEGSATGQKLRIRFDGV